MLRRRGRQRTRWLDGFTNSMDISLRKAPGDEGQGSLVCCSPWGRKELDDFTNSMDISLSKALGDGEGQGSLVCCSPWGRKESDMTE